MKINEMEKIYVNWDLVRFTTEDKIKNHCMALAHYKWNDENNELETYDLMVYLFKDNNKWFVIIYKSEEEDDFDNFEFDSFIDAIEFIYPLWKHPEYNSRPFKRVYI